jgi:hypothetical protein
MTVGYNSSLKIHAALAYDEKGTENALYFSSFNAIHNILWIQTNKTNSVVLVRKRTIPTERPPLIGKVSADFCR